MNPYANEEIMWQRLKDLQREAEQSRLIAHERLPSLVQLAERLWLLAGLAMRRAPRWSPPRVVHADRDDASKVA